MCLKQYELQLVSFHIMGSRKHEIVIALAHKRRALHKKSCNNRGAELTRSKNQCPYQVSREQTLEKGEIHYAESKHVISSKKKSFCNTDSKSKEHMYSQDCNTTEEIARNSYESVDFFIDGLNRHDFWFRDRQFNKISKKLAAKFQKKELNYLLNCVGKDLLQSL